MLAALQPAAVKVEPRAQACTPLRERVSRVAHAEPRKLDQFYNFGHNCPT